MELVTDNHIATADTNRIEAPITLKAYLMVITPTESLRIEKR